MSWPFHHDPRLSLFQLSWHFGSLKFSVGRCPVHCPCLLVWWHSGLHTHHTRCQITHQLLSGKYNSIVLFPTHCLTLSLNQKIKSEWVHMCLCECLYMCKHATVVWMFEFSQIIMLKRSKQCHRFGRGDFGEHSTFTCRGTALPKKDLKVCNCSYVVWRHIKKVPSVNQEVFLHETVNLLAPSAGTLRTVGKKLLSLVNFKVPGFY